MYYAILDYQSRLMQFMDSGGPVLWLIAFLTFLMWTAILERIWYFHSGLRHDVSSAVNTWEARSEHSSWNAANIRRRMISQIGIQIQQNMSMIKTMVALCPLLGLLALGSCFQLVHVLSQFHSVVLYGFDLISFPLPRKVF